MHIFAIPRHQIETTAFDYARMAGALLGRRERLDATAAFEREFAEYVGCRHAIAVSSGRLGLHVLLEALGLGPGDEVIVPAFNLFAVVERFCQLGLTPRFCDIRREDFNIDAALAETHITPRTRVLLATHMFGHPADVRALGDLARRRNLILLEDCAHALGSRVGERSVGTFGAAAIYSFSVLKLVTTFGGGMVTTDDDALAGAIRRRLGDLRAVQPRAKGFKKAITGAIMDVGTRRWPFSFGAWPVLRALRAIRPDFQRKMMTETPRTDRQFRPETVPPLHPFQARLGRSQLRRVEELIEARRRVGAWLDAELRGIPQITPPKGSDSSDSRANGLYYGILADRAGELCEYLFRRGIDCETSEYLNCADLPMYREFFVDCPVAREVQARIVRLPNYPSLTRPDVARIGRAVRAFYAMKGRSLADKPPVAPGVTHKA